MATAAVLCQPNNYSSIYSQVYKARPKLREWRQIGIPQWINYKYYLHASFASLLLSGRLQLQPSIHLQMRIILLVPNANRSCWSDFITAAFLVMSFLNPKTQRKTAATTYGSGDDTHKKHLWLFSGRKVLLGFRF